MCGLPQAGILAQQQLEQQLNEHGYHQSPLPLGLWKHKTGPISFTLCVNDLGVKYVGREHEEHLLQILKAHYKCTIDWEDKKYLGMDINCDYMQQIVLGSMLEYVPAAPTKDTPATLPAWQANLWCNSPIRGRPRNIRTKKSYVQEVIGAFLY